MNVYNFGYTSETPSLAQDTREQRPRKRSVSLYTLSNLLGGAEFLTVVLSGFIAKLFYIDLFLNHSTGYLETNLPYLLAAVTVAVLNTNIFNRTGLYAADQLIHRSIKMSQIVVSLVLSFMFLFSLLYVVQQSAYFSRMWIGIWFIICLLTIMLIRSFFYLYIRALTAELRLSEKIAILGTDELGRKVGAYLKRKYGPVIEIIGYFDEHPETSAAANRESDGNVMDLMALARRNQCDQIIIALPLSEKYRVADIIARLSVLPVEVQYCPEIMEMPFPVHGSRNLGELHLLDVQHRPISEQADLIKTTFDYVVGTLSLLVFGPLMALIALAIKLESPGPVLFIQKRHGYNHRIISVMKFRTMRQSDADDKNVVQATKGDSRVTRVGAFLRKTSLDELPQLFNVLKGEMSLIGPRPHALAHNAEYEKLIARYSARHRVKPGLTGWAQVNGYRGNTEDPELMRKRIEYDLEYIENWSLWFDLKILLLTPLRGFVNANAY